MRLVYPDPPLADRVVALREWRAEDLDCVRAAAKDPRIPDDTSVPFTVEEGLAFIERQRRQIIDGEGVALAIVERVGDCAVGHVWLGVRPRPSVFEVGYWVSAPTRLRGSRYVSGGPVGVQRAGSCPPRGVGRPW